MLQISKLISQGAGLAPVLVRRACTLQIDWDMRQKNRFDVTDSLGRPLGVFLPHGTLVRGGDVLLAKDGSMVRVIAAPQAVLRITACLLHGSVFDLTRAAYHLGKCHVPVELKPDHLKIEPDHVLADMLRAMHLDVEEVNEAFEPEGSTCTVVSHSHTLASKVTSAPQAAHMHGPGCTHKHDHNHAQQAAQPVNIQIHPRKPHSH